MAMPEVEAGGAEIRRNKDCSSKSPTYHNILFTKDEAIRTPAWAAWPGRSGWGGVVPSDYGLSGYLLVV